MAASATRASSSSASTFGASSASRALQLELKGLQSEPVEGFTVTCDDNCLFKWTVGIFGPPGTLYQGGYFKAQLSFPSNYPYSPPTMKFINTIWHPNVYENGDLCISILHAPIDDPQSGELPSERWNPTQSVRTILLSVISLLNEPNTSSPANVDASVMFRAWRDSKGVDARYADRVKADVEKSKKVAQEDGVKVPETVEEYTVKHKKPEPDSMEIDEDYYDYEYESDVQDNEDDDEHDDDSGQGDD
uniref:UBC core domain-containing protein n=1 Tax=Panagrellus redivivus TaxID=6233 RepID=A0A7E4UM45_PANRE